MGETTNIHSNLTTHRRLGRLRLRVLTGVDEGKEFEITKDRVKGGRGAANEIVLSQPSVSTSHFEICLKEDRILIRDRDSTNGLYARGLRVKEAWLEVGTIFVAGDCEIVLLSAEEREVEISRDPHFGGMLGQSVRIREVFAQLERLATLEIDVLLTGETGTGKDRAARELHRYSARRDKPFVVLDCGALPRDLAESVILGHSKGSFTGASYNNIGYFEAANGGILFLDEIGELPLELQPKLLRVLDSREVRRVGETQVRPVDVRVVAATHRDLRDDIAAGRFREDLYHRLSDVTIEMPSLRERPEDIIVLARAFLEEHSRSRVDRDWRPVLAEDAVAALERYSWPGNVRELTRVMRRVALLSTRPEIHREDLKLIPGREADASIDTWMDRPAKAKEARKAFERDYYSRLIQKTSGDLNEAAKIADVTVQGLRSALERLGLR